MTRVSVLAVASVLFVPGPTRGEVVPNAVHPTVTLMPAQGSTRTVDFITEEGTWMSVDASPTDGRLVFDLLGHIYAMPATGGDAVCLTQDSGPAINVHPRFSPDGKTVAFISDRTGQENLWIMDADGGDPRPISLEAGFRHREPAWMPDGRGIFVTRQAPTDTGYLKLSTEIWMYPVDGGPGTRVASGTMLEYRWPSITPDGRHLYYFTTKGLAGTGIGASIGHYIQGIDLVSGAKHFLRGHPQLDVETAVAHGSLGVGLRDPALSSRIPAVGDAEMAPEVSPDGKWIAFAARVPGSTQEYRKHHYGPRTALMARNLKTGQERTLLDPMTIDTARVHVGYSSRVLPGYAWTRDSRSIIVSHEGKIGRVEVQSGRVSYIPFRARVHRTLSEQPRSRVDVDEEQLTVKFLQWPSTSPDGRSLTFVAVGRLWIVDLPDGVPRVLTSVEPDVLYLTPSWSPDGSRVAFATWHDLRQGHVWSVAGDGGGAKRHTSRSGRYLFPEWSSDGRSLVVMRGPGVGAPEEWNGWERDGAWEVVKISGADGTQNVLAVSSHLTRPHFGPEGRVYFAAYMNDRTLLRSIGPDDSQPIDYLRLPAAGSYPIDSRAEPMISPDGRWVAYQAARSIYVVAAPPRSATGDVPFIDTNPNAEIADRTRIGSRGGLYHRWRDEQRLELASGNIHVAYRADTGELEMHPVDLTVPGRAPSGTIALTNVRVITLDGDKVFDSADVVVRNARIECVGHCETAGADQVLDLTGKVIVPGFVDVHAHHTRRNSPVVTQHWYPTALDLAYGVTTILDPGTLSTSAFPLAEMTAAGVIVGPRIYSTAENIYGWGDRVRIDAYEDSRFEVGWRADWGAISIKNYRLQRREQQQLLLQTARERNITATGEGGYLHRIVAMAIDGQTGWEHMIPYLPVYSDLATFVGKAGMVYSPTVSTAGHYKGMADFYRRRHDLSSDTKYRRFMPLRAIEKAMARVRVEEIPFEFSFPMIAEGLRDIIHAGGYGALGEHGEQPGIGTHWEMWSYAEALSPLEALTVASKHGAYFIGLESEIGSVEPGKLADLVILNADPLADIRSTQDIAYVMKGGRLYDDDTLDELWPEPRKYGPAPWIRRSMQDAGADIESGIR